MVEARVLVDGEVADEDALAPAWRLGGVAHTAGVFTTARVSAGVVVRSAAHLDRLRRESRDAARAEQAWQEACALASGWDAGMLRVVLGERRVVAIAPARRAPWRVGDRGLVLQAAEDPRRDGAYVKEVARQAFAALEEKARAAGADGVLLRGAAGERPVHEGTWFHLLARVDGRWLTPAQALVGTTLPAVPLAVERRTISWRELMRADCVLACSSLLGVAPVDRIGERAFRWRNAEIPRVPM